MDRLRLRGLGKNILLSLMTFALLFGIAEVSCRLFYDESENYEKGVWESLDRLDFSSNGRTYTHPEDGIVYYLEDGSIYEDYYIYSDWRMPELNSSGLYRIAVIGDSFSNGGGLLPSEMDNHSYTRVLFDMLNNESLDKPERPGGFNVLTVSQGGINTYQELILFREIVLPQRPDMVILQYCNNDIRLPRSELGFDGSGMFIRSRTKLLMLGDIYAPAFPYIGEDVSWHLLRHSAFMRFVSYKMSIMLQDNAVDVESSFSSVRELKRLCDEHGIEFIIINFPPAAHTEENCGEENTDNLMAGIDINHELERLTEELGIKYMSMCDHIDDIHDIKSPNEPEDGCHYSKEGYRIAAGVLRDAVLDEIEGAREMNPADR